MTRKDYIAIAEILHRYIVVNGERTSPGQLAYVADDLAGIMERENPRFDRVKFLGACGL